jgi:radical SAM superfamily enzyme YgiQ (UPF0313 family)
MGLAFLAGAAKREGHEVIVYNGEHDPKLDYVNLTTYSANYHHYLEALDDPNHPAWKRIAKLMASFKPDVVGLTAFSVKWPSAQRIAALAKDYNPRVPVIAGGQHVTIMTDQVLADPNLDFVIRGEAELTFVDFLRQVENGQQWHNVAGLSFKHEGRIVHNPQRPLVENLDDLALPAALGKLFASRGCPYQCNYCGTQNVWGYGVRHRSAQSMIDEIRQVKKDYGTNYFTFFDDVFGLDKKRAIALCDAMSAAKLGVRWDCLTRANLVSDELLVSMKKAGCVKIDMGVESGSDKILKDTKKGLNTEQLLAGGKLIKKHGLFLYCFFMIGLPTETEGDAEKTIEFLENLKPHWAGISIFTPIPGTGIYKTLELQGKIAKNPNFAQFSHQSPNSNFAFSMGNRDAFPKLAQATLEYIEHYNGSYRNLLRRAASRGYHRNPRLFVSDLKKVLTWKQWMQTSHSSSHSKFYTKASRSMLEREAR